MANVSKHAILYKAYSHLYYEKIHCTQHTVHMSYVQYIVLYDVISCTIVSQVVLLEEHDRY